MRFRYIKKIVPVCVLTLLASGASGSLSEPADHLEVLEQADRKVEVTREYIPEIRITPKKFMEPNMLDTMLLRPELNYTIRSVAWQRGGFGVAAINPVQMSAARYEPNYPFYVKLGGGFPGQSIVDFYGGSRESATGFVGGYLTHYGQYGKIKSDLGNKERAMQSSNRVGVFGKLNVNRKLALRVEGGASYDIWSRYGAWVNMRDDITTPLTGKSPRQSYTMPFARLEFGNDFKDLTYLNFRLGADGYYLQDKNKNKEAGITSFLEVGKMFGVHKLMLGAEFRSTFGGGGLKGYYDRIFTISPQYGIVTDKFKLDARLDFSYNVASKRSSKLYFLPQARITFDLVEWFTPYVELESQIISNGLRTLSNRNPYLDPEYLDIKGSRAETILPSHSFDNTREYSFRAGIAGGVGSNFSYRVYGGATIYKDPLFFYYLNLMGMDNTNQFMNAGFGTSRHKRMTTVLFGAELEGRISDSFTAILKANYYDYSVTKTDIKPTEITEGETIILPKKAFDLPNFEADLRVRYNYRKKFFITAGIKLIGERNFFEVTRSDEKVLSQDGLGYLPAPLIANERKQGVVVDLSLELEYRLKRGLGLFIEGHNLTNSKLYHFNHYPDRGVRVNGGVKLIF